MREQWEAIQLSRRWLTCLLFDHQAPVLIMYRGQMMNVCPRCGKDLDVS